MRMRLLGHQELGSGPRKAKDTVWGSEDYGLMWMDLFQQKINPYRKDHEEYAGDLSFFLRALVCLIFQFKVNGPLPENGWFLLN